MKKLLLLVVLLGGVFGLVAAGVACVETYGNPLAGFTNPFATQDLKRVHLALPSQFRHIRGCRGWFLGTAGKASRDPRVVIDEGCAHLRETSW